MSLFTELKRRNVFRVGAAYLVVGWLLLQIADVLLGNFGAPAWAFKSFAAILALGLPVALFLAWAFELTPDGVRREDEHSDDTAPAPRRHLGSNVLIVAGLIAIIGVLVVERVWFAGKPPDATAQDVETTPTVEPEPSIAVLPFVNMSGSADNEYFSDGLTETLLHKLAQVAELKVAARTSSFAFKDQNRDIREIAAALGVANILEGSVQRAGDRVRITAQLIQADDGYHLWSQVFDRSLDDIFAVQDDIAVQVASALRGSLLEESAVADAGGTDNTEAYDWYLRGRDALFDSNAERLADAVNAMRRAITLDPQFANAWAGLSEALWKRARFTGRELDEGLGDEIIESARTAVRLAPDSAIARIALGEALWRPGGDRPGAQEQFERAVGLEPQNPRALTALSGLLLNMQRTNEAVELAERAMAIDPLDWDAKAGAVTTYVSVGRLDQAERLAKSILDWDPDYVPGLASLGFVYWLSGEQVKAYRTFHRLLQINPRAAYVMERIASLFFSLGDFDGATRWLERANAISPDAGIWLRELILRAKGDTERAVEYVQQHADRIDSRTAGSTLEGLSWAELQVAYLRGDWTTLYTMSAAFLDHSKPADTTNRVFDARNAMALAADRLGRSEERDRLLAVQQQHIDRLRESGAAYALIHFEQALTHAISGDAKATRDALELAYEAGAIALPLVNTAPEFEKVRDSDEIRTLFERIDEQNAARLERLLEVERELGDFAGEPVGVQETES